MLEYCKKLKTDIIGIPENSGIFNNDGVISVVGDGDVVVFPQGEIYKKDSILP